MKNRLSRMISLAVILVTITMSLFLTWNGKPLPRAIAQDGTVESNH